MRPAPIEIICRSLSLFQKLYDSKLGKLVMESSDDQKHVGAMKSKPHGQCQKLEVQPFPREKNVKSIR